MWNKSLMVKTHKKKDMWLCELNNEKWLNYVTCTTNTWSNWLYLWFLRVAWDVENVYDIAKLKERNPEAAYGNVVWSRSEGKIRYPDFGALPKKVWQNPMRNTQTAWHRFPQNQLREFFGGKSIMFQWLDAMAKARELQLSNEKITSVVRVAKHWDQKKTFTDYVWRDEPCLTGLTAWHRQEWWSLTTRRLVAWSVRRKTEYKYRWQIDASFERRTHHVWFYESAR